MTANWDTNLNAAERDSIVLFSPTGAGPFIAKKQNVPDGIHHSVTKTNVPCEPGVWTLIVKSTRNGRTATSAANTFFVPPSTLVTSGSVSGDFTCPAGPVDFDGACVATIDAAHMELQALPMDPLNRKMAFFPQDTPQPADGPAASPNFTTTITEPQVGGCNGGTAELYLNGFLMGTVFQAPPPVMATQLAHIAGRISFEAKRGFD